MPLPWHVEVPVRPSRFEALDPDHRALNVEVDLGAIASFGFGGGDADVLSCDLQSSAGVNYGVILGSGRSGFYRDKYLKGIGRTLLSGNWNRPGAAYHASGHLMASAAVRELVVSRYLQANGLGDTLVPCEGILLAPLDPRLVGFHDAVFPGHEVPAIDRHLQAISVKPAGFVRASNLLWLLEHGTPHNLAASFFQGLAIGLGEGDADLDPTALAAALARAVDRTLGHFEAWLRSGVYWGSFHNNLTLDGRFLDLECATLFGGPFLGVLEEGSPPAAGGRPRSFAGCEVLSWLVEMRRTLELFRRRWQFLLEERIARQPVEREFVEEFFAALDAELPAEHAARDPSRAFAASAAMIERAIAAPASRRGEIRSALLAHQAWLESASEAPSSEALALRALPLSLSRSESIHRRVALGVDFLPPHDRAEAQRIHRALDAIDAESTVEGVATALATLLHEIDDNPAARRTLVRFGRSG